MIQLGKIYPENKQNVANKLHIAPKPIISDCGLRLRLWCFWCFTFMMSFKAYDFILTLL